MSHELDRLIGKYANRGLLIDANLLVLLIVGQYQPDRLSVFKATKSYDKHDLELLVFLVTLFTQVVTTPHVLTEVNGFLNQMPEKDRESCLEFFGGELTRFDEKWKAGEELAALDCFSWLGLSDCGIMEVAGDAYLVLTADANLHYALLDRGMDSINFHHLRIR